MRSALSSRSLWNATIALLLGLVLLLVVGCPTGRGGGGGGDDDDDDDAADDDDATPYVPTIDEEFHEDLMAALESELASSGHPGIQVGIRIPGGLVWEGVVGVSDQSSGRELRRTDGFKIGQITGTFLVGALFQIQELTEGVALHDVATLWIPMPEGYGMTIHQLLGHIGGVPDYRSKPDFDPTAHAELEELFALVEDDPLLWGPGGDWLDSFTDYVLAGMVVEAITDNEWQEELDERFFGPLGLDHTRAPAVGEGWGDVARGYSGSTDVTGANVPAAWGSAAGMVSTGGDLATWGHALLRSDLLGDQSMNDIINTYFAAQGIWYGLGIQVKDSDRGFTEIGHFSEVDGYVGWLGYRSDLDASIAVLGNGGGSWESAYDIGQALWEVVEQHIDDVGPGDDDDDDTPDVSQPRGQAQLWVTRQFDHIGTPAQPNHNGVRLTGWWDFDNDGETVGYVTVTSAEYGSGAPIDPVSCNVTVNGSFGDSKFGDPAGGAINFHHHEQQPCDDWPEVEQWSNLLGSEFNSMDMIPYDWMPSDWTPSYSGASGDMNGADSLREYADEWLATTGVEMNAAAVTFFVAAELPSLYGGGDPYLPPTALLGFLWQRPGEM